MLNPKTPSDQNIVAAFDFDGTLTYRDSMIPFLLYCSGSLKSPFHFLRESPTLLKYSLGLVSRQFTKEKILSRFFPATPIDLIRQKGQNFASDRLNQLLNPSMMQKFHWHLNQGHHCILISASIDVYLEPWASHDQRFLSLLPLPHQTLIRYHNHSQHQKIMIQFCLL